eukprot:g12313.t1
MSPHLMLLLFLPALIFESAFTVNFHTFSHEAVQALLLAVPGVVISAALTAVFVWYVFRPYYDWSIPVCLMFGSALSATDPVAVVALLREIGASKRLSTLIEAESLINDGSAYVLFLIFKDVATGMPKSAGDIAIDFARLSIGGPLLGTVFGFFVFEWIRRIDEDSLQETTLTLCASYCVFWVAEESGLRVSGVLAVVALGLYAAKHRTAMSPSSEDKVHHTWEMVSWLANTLLFFLAGAIIVNSMNANKKEQLTIGWLDVGLLFALFIWMHIARAFTLLVLSPCLTKTGYGMKPKTAAVLVWGALRGAIALAIGLLVELEPSIPESVSARVMFHIAGFTVLTLLINGTTTGILIRKLGLEQPSLARMDVYARAIGILAINQEKAIHQLETDTRFQGANLTLVHKLSPDFATIGQRRQSAMAEMALEKCQAKVKDNTGLSDELGQPLLQDSLESEGEQADPAIWKEIHLRFITSMQKHFLEMLEKNEISREAAAILVESCEEAIDVTDLNEGAQGEGDALLAQFDLIRQYLPVDALLAFRHRMKLPYGQRGLYKHLALSMELVTAYKEALSCVHNLSDICTAETHLRLQATVKELHRRVRSEASHLRTAYPRVFEAVQSRAMTAQVIIEQGQMLEDLSLKGMVNEKEYQELKMHLDETTHKLRWWMPRSRTWNLRVQDFFSRLEWFQHLPPDLQQLLLKQKKCVFLQGEVLMEEGKVPEGIHLVAHGVVHIFSDPQSNPYAGEDDVDRPARRHKGHLGHQSPSNPDQELKLSSGSRGGGSRGKSPRSPTRNVRFDDEEDMMTSPSASPRPLDLGAKKLPTRVLAASEKQYPTEGMATEATVTQMTASPFKHKRWNTVGREMLGDGTVGSLCYLTRHRAEREARAASMVHTIFLPPYVMTALMAQPEAAAFFWKGAARTLLECKFGRQMQEDFKLDFSAESSAFRSYLEDLMKNSYILETSPSHPQVLSLRRPIVLLAGEGTNVQSGFVTRAPALILAGDCSLIEFTAKSVVLVLHPAMSPSRAKGEIEGKWEDLRRHTSDSSLAPTSLATSSPRNVSSYPGSKTNLCKVRSMENVQDATRRNYNGITLNRRPQRQQSRHRTCSHLDSHTEMAPFNTSMEREMVRAHSHHVIHPIDHPGPSPPPLSPPESPRGREEKERDLQTFLPRRSPSPPLDLSSSDIPNVGMGPLSPILFPPHLVSRTPSAAPQLSEAEVPQVALSRSAPTANDTVDFDLSADRSAVRTGRQGGPLLMERGKSDEQGLGTWGTIPQFSAHNVVRILRAPHARSIF